MIETSSSAATDTSTKTDTGHLTMRERSICQKFIVAVKNFNIVLSKINELLHERQYTEAMYCVSQVNIHEEIIESIKSMMPSELRARDADMFNEVWSVYSEMNQLLQDNLQLLNVTLEVSGYFVERVGKIIAERTKNLVGYKANANYNSKELCNSMPALTMNNMV